MFKTTQAEKWYDEVRRLRAQRDALAAALRACALRMSLMTRNGADDAALNEAEAALLAVED